MKDDGPARSRWRPGVRFVLVLVVLIPMVSVAFLTASDASSRWSYRLGAQVVAKDAIALKQVALASAQTINALNTTYAVTYGSQLGLKESQLSALMGVDLGAEIQQEVSVMRADRTFVSTPALRADSKAFFAVIPRIQAGTLSVSQSGAMNVKFSSDVVDLWFSDFNRLQKDVEALQTPGSFGVRVASLRQTYT
ncbi:MAG: hypothetical protein ABSH04_05965, partial [Acidimicrobiales bacterium]